jgi:hypothetical protein
MITLNLHDDSVRLHAIVRGYDHPESIKSTTYITVRGYDHLGFDLITLILFSYRPWL